MTALGGLYWYGIGTRPGQSSKAEQWWGQAARAGGRAAMRNLAAYYKAGGADRKLERVGPGAGQPLGRQARRG